MLSSGCNFLKKSFFDQSLEDFYKEAKDKFEFRFGLKAATEPVSCEDLNILRSKHMGAFGQALMIQHKKNKIHYVMKLINKEQILKEEKNVDSLLKQKKILEACNFPFILKLAHCIQDKNHLLMLYQLKPSEDYFR